MQEWLGTMAAWHAATAGRVLRATSPWALLVPAVGALAIAGLDTQPAVAPYLTKASAEILSPMVLAIGTTVAVWLAATRPHVYYKWQALFVFACFLRELHFQGTNTGFYIAAVLLLGWVSHARERLEPFISDRRIMTLLVSVLWTYFISKTFDRHLWDGLLTGVPMRDLFEENLELLGHILLVVLVLVSALVKLGAPAGAPASQPARKRLIAPWRSQTESSRS